jgi:Spx/MgsR family transcriptional regulator
MSLIVYGIPNCDTVKQARAWLAAQGLDYTFHDYKKQGVPADRLSAWIAERGFDALLDRQGTTWRKLDEATRARVVDAASAVALMQASASVIRRPVIERDGQVIAVGFDAEAQRTLSAAAPGARQPPRTPRQTPR